MQTKQVTFEISMFLLNAIVELYCIVVYTQSYLIRIVFGDLERFTIIFMDIKKFNSNLLNQNTLYLFIKLLARASSHHQQQTDKGIEYVTIKIKSTDHPSGTNPGTTKNYNLPNLKFNWTIKQQSCPEGLNCWTVAVIGNYSNEGNEGKQLSSGIHKPNHNTHAFH